MSTLANYIRDDINYCQQFFKVILSRYAGKVFHAHFYLPWPNRHITDNISLITTCKILSFDVYQIESQSRSQPSMCSIIFFIYYSSYCWLRKKRIFFCICNTAVYRGKRTDSLHGAVNCSHSLNKGFESINPWVYFYWKV